MPGFVVPANIDFGLCLPGEQASQPGDTGLLKFTPDTAANESLVLNYGMKIGTYFSAKLVTGNGRIGYRDWGSGSTLKNDGSDYQFQIVFTPGRAPIPGRFADTLVLSWPGSDPDTEVLLSGETAELSLRVTTSPNYVGLGSAIAGGENRLATAAVVEVQIEYLSPVDRPVTVSFALDENAAPAAHDFDIKFPEPVEVSPPGNTSETAKRGPGLLEHLGPIRFWRPTYVSFTITGLEGAPQGQVEIPLVATAEGAPAPVSPVGFEIVVDVTP